MTNQREKRGVFNMSYLSYHAGTAGKIKRKEVKKISGHTYRKTDPRYKEHKNKEIDKTLTEYNVDYLKNGKTLEALVEERIQNDFKGKRKLRNDAVVIREIIVQPSADEYEDMTIEEKQEKAIRFTEDSMEWIKEEFGEDNILGYSIHMDETNPHTHISFMPMTDDGRMSQKDFFRGPGSLREQHKRFREHMNNLGWDFDLENKYEDAEKVPTEVYKKQSDTIEKARQEQTDAVRKSKTAIAEIKENEDVEIKASMGRIKKAKDEEKTAVRESRDKINQLTTDAFLNDEVAAKLVAHKERLKEENEELERKKESLAFQVGFAEAIRDAKPKVASRKEINEKMLSATGGKFRTARNNKTKEWHIVEMAQDKIKGAVSLERVVEHVYGMGDGDIFVDSSYKESKELSYAVAHHNSKGQPISDYEAHSEGFKAVSTAVFEKQKQLDKEKTL